MQHGRVEAEEGPVQFEGQSNSLLRPLKGLKVIGGTRDIRRGILKSWLEEVTQGTFLELKSQKGRALSKMSVFDAFAQAVCNYDLASLPTNIRRKRFPKATDQDDSDEEEAREPASSSFSSSSSSFAAPSMPKQTLRELLQEVKELLEDGFLSHRRGGTEEQSKNPAAPVRYRRHARARKEKRKLDKIGMYHDSKQTKGTHLLVECREKISIKTLGLYDRPFQANKRNTKRSPLLHRC